MKILAGTLFDGTGSTPASRVRIDIEGAHIAAVTPWDGNEIEGDDVIDARSSAVLPGLINCHDHFSYHGRPGSIEQMMDKDRARLAIQAMAMARQNVSQGISTVRSTGDKDHLDVVLRTAIEEGVVDGPRIVAAGPPLMMTGGHGFPVGREVDGVDALRAETRRLFKGGSDLAKVIATGGILASRRGEEPFLPELTVDEIRAVVDVAHGLGHKVAAHAHGAPGIGNCVDAGVDSIEHGTLITPELAARMTDRGTVLVPTMSALYRYAFRGVELGRPKASQEAAARVYDDALAALADVVSTGVKIVAGSDSLGDLVEEIELLSDAGLGTLGALRAATGLAAELLAVESGVVEPGRYADLIIVDGDPTTKLGDLRKVCQTIIGGRTVWQR